jgi:hypothetical protein
VRKAENDTADTSGGSNLAELRLIHGDAHSAFVKTVSEFQTGG